MKKVFASLFTFALLLSGCSFLDGLTPSSSESGGSSQTEENKITSFEFVTDTNMTLETSESGSFNLLTIYVNDTYQIRTDVDDKIGNDYYFEYSNYDEEVVSVSSTGLVTGLKKDVDSVDVTLYRRKDNKKIKTKYFIVNVREQSDEYANITINDSSLEYDESTKTYSLTLKGGDSYNIPTSVKFNVSYSKVFELENDSYSSFMNVSASGLITTQKVTEDKDGRVVIKTVSSDNTKVYDTIYLNVHVEKSEEVVTKELKVFNLTTGEEYKDGDELSLFVNDSATFIVKYGGSNKYNVSTISNTDVLSLDNDLNKITALSVGKSDITFICEDKSLTLHIEVIENALVEIYSKNGAEDFVIVNNSLKYLGRMFAKYASGLIQDITGSKGLTFVISDLNATHKSVVFSYTSNGITKTVTYEVKYFTAVDYSMDNTSYNMSDYFNNRSRGKYFVLPNEGEINMLVIPVWFTNSNNFFRNDQKEEILEDLEYVYNTNRDKDSFHSVKQFYEEESNGKLTLNINISEFFEPGTSTKQYGDTVQSDILNTYSLADSAVQWYFANHTSESIDDYDSNDDGLVDAVSLVYAANYYGTIGDSNGTTAFQIKNSQGDDHKFNNGSFSPIGGIYGFNKSSDVNNQLNAPDLSKYYPRYFTSGCRTIIHETGHMFGYEDLYEDNHATTKYYPAGRFSMQSHEFGGHEPYQNNLVGWSKPDIYDANDYEVGETITVKINDYATSGNNILLTNKMNANNSLFDEYMLLELFAPTGLNYYDAKNSAVNFTEPGIRLWHVNSILEDYTNSGKETTEISNNNWVNLKYSNNDQSSEFDLAHWIRNNPEEPYDTTSTVKNSYGLFKAGDHFDIGTYQSQFVNGDKLDNKEKLGWEFNVDSIYQTVDNEYGAIITLTRVDNTRTDFEFESRINKDIAVQPTEDGNDYAKALLGDDELFSLIYNFNNASIPSYYTQGYPISSRGVCLFASTDGNGGSLVITIKDKEGYTVKITSISITSTMLTKASVTALVNGEVVVGTSFTGPYNNYDEYNEKGLTFEVNNNSVTIQNKYTGGTDYWSVLAIYSVSINYHIEKI